MSEMISFDLDGWKAISEISKGAILIEETPILTCLANVPAGWKKLAKKVSKIESDPRPEGCPDTLPPWSSVTLSEAIIRLLYGFDSSPVPLKKSILELYNEQDLCVDSPFESLIRKAKALVMKDAPKIGISKSTIASLSEILRILTTKVCVTTDGSAVLFRNLGSVQHSCMPNCMFIPRGSSGQLIAIRDIIPGDLVTCSHIPTNCLRAGVDSRQAWLRGVAGTRCRSACCVSGFDVRRQVPCPRCLDSECLAAKSVGSSPPIWVGQKCSQEMPEEEAIDVQKEAQLIKKIIYLNEADIDINRLFQFTQATIADASKSFGKSHFCYQQILLLQCGLALHSLCSGPVSRRLFAAWVQMLVEVYNFSLATKLPFEGMDELVRILLAPATLQMAVSFMGTFPHYTDLMSASAVATFSLFVEQSCECLILIEGPDSSHTSDGIKLRNWWLKKFSSWSAIPEEIEPAVTLEEIESAVTPNEIASAVTPEEAQPTEPLPEKDSNSEIADVKSNESSKWIRRANILGLTVATATVVWFLVHRRK